jgi:hypothetical protein
MLNVITFWWSVIATAIGLVIAGVTIWQISSSRSEAKRKKDQVKIWQQDAHGISQALRRIVEDTDRGKYTGKKDVANAVWSVESAAFSLYQSLYEERAVTEEEYKQRQREFFEMWKKRGPGETPAIAPKEKPTNKTK